MRRWLVWLPLAGFAALMLVVAAGLFSPADRAVRSALIGEPLPEFTLPAMLPTLPTTDSAGFRAGEPRLLNVFASWCVPCIVEAPQLMRLKQMGVAIDAVAIRDTAPAVAGFLADHGNPYRRIGDDQESAVQLALGSGGVPETFVVDGRGRIVMQHIGEIRAEHVPAILAALEQAR